MERDPFLQRVAAHLGRVRGASVPPVPRLRGSSGEIVSGRRSGAEAIGAQAEPEVAARGAASGSEAGHRQAPDREALLERFAGRLAELGGRAFVVAGRAEAHAAVEALLQGRPSGALCCPAGLRWPEVEYLCGDEPSTASFGLSEARWAIAEIGTVVLWHEAGRPRSPSLVPPAAGFFVPASRVVAGLEAVLADVAAAGQDLPACITFMTGPSRSMDIGYEVCVGVHGPGETTVWILADE